MFYTFGLVSWSLVDYLERKIKSRKCTALLVRTNFFFTLKVLDVTARLLGRIRSQSEQRTGKSQRNRRRQNSIAAANGIVSCRLVSPLSKIKKKKKEEKEKGQTFSSIERKIYFLSQKQGIARNSVVSRSHEESRGVRTTTALLSLRSLQQTNIDSLSLSLISSL